MKKILFSTLAVITISIASQAQVRVGLTGGGNLTNQRLNVEGKSLYAGSQFKGYHAGLTSDIRISDHLYLQPQLLYSRKGATLLSSTGDADVEVRMNYVELPVSLLYKLNLPFGKLFGGAGAAFSYGIGGKLEQDGKKTNLYADGTDWKRKDVSMRFTGGVEFSNGFFFSVHSQRSLLDISKADGVSVKNKSFGVSVGYLVNWHK